MTLLLAAFLLQAGSLEPAWTLERALAGIKAPPSILKQQQLVAVPYLGFDDVSRTGYLVVHRSLAKEVREIFDEIYKSGFQIEKIVPIVAFDWDDHKSTTANNSSGFNYRTISGSTRISQHAYGRAIDINPWQNPWESPRAKPGTQGPYVPGTLGTIQRNGPVVRAFKRRGWTWGGDWKVKDYQHFEKR